MAKEFEDKFFDELKSGVISNDTSKKDELIAKREELKLALDELNANVIRDPKAVQKIQKELAEVEKQIEEGEVTSDNKPNQDVDKDVKEQEEKDEVGLKDEENLNKEEKVEEAEKEESLKQVYYNSMVAMYERRIADAQSAIDKGQLIVDRSDFEEELNLEAKMYEARDSYLDLGKDDPYTEKRTELIRKEKEAKEKMELQLREKARKYKELEDELRKIDEETSEINEKLMNPEIKDTQVEELNKRLEKLAYQRKDIEIKLAEIKEDLEPAIKERRMRSLERAGLEEKHVETLTHEDKKNYDYQQKKVNQMNDNFDKATKQEYTNIQKRIEERESKIRTINKELKELEESGNTDFERRLLLLNELDKETNMLEADREAKSDMERGIEPTEKEMKKDAKEKVDKEEYRQEQFDKATEGAREVVEEQNEKLGAMSVSNPMDAQANEEKERDTEMKAAAVAIVYDSPDGKKDTPLENGLQYVGAKCVIEGLEDKVYNIDDTEEGRKNAEACINQDKELKKADNELDKVQDRLQKQ